MDNIFRCIDEYIKELEVEIMSIVSNTSIPLTKKNSLMKPIADQKLILENTKESLKRVKERVYEESCGYGDLAKKSLKR